MLKIFFPEIEDMAERTEGKQICERKRSLPEAAARARTAKAARWTTDGAPVIAGPSSRQAASLFTEHQQRERDETSANESESENERQNDSSSSDENVQLRAQVFDEFMVSLPLPLTLPPVRGNYKVEGGK